MRRHNSWSRINRAVVHALEARRLLTCSIELDDGTLTVEGDSGNNRITITQDDEQLVVRCNGGMRETFDSGDVQAIDVDGRKGNDQIVVLLEEDTQIEDVQVDGGNGNDTVDVAFGEDEDDEDENGNGNGIGNGNGDEEEDEDESLDVDVAVSGGFGHDNLEIEIITDEDDDEDDEDENGNGNGNGDEDEEDENGNGSEDEEDEEELDVDLSIDGGPGNDTVVAEVALHEEDDGEIF